MLPETECAREHFHVSPPVRSHAQLEEAAVATCQEVSTQTQLHEARRQPRVLQDGLLMMSQKPASRPLCTSSQLLGMQNSNQNPATPLHYHVSETILAAQFHQVPRCWMPKMVVSSLH